MSDIYSKGLAGEELAVSYLKQRGYRILERRFRTTRGEIDIIVVKDNIISFVEVKTGSKGRFGGPTDWIPFSKKRRIALAAAEYLQRHPQNKLMPRFDAVLISNGKIRHIENAFITETSMFDNDS